MANIVDYILEEDMERYNELLDKAQELKKAAPKAPRKPMSPEAKLKAAKSRYEKAQAKLAALLEGEDDSEDADKE